MKNNEIKIRIGGKSGLGKSTIAKIIYDALPKKGFVVNFDDEGCSKDDVFFDKELQKKRIEGLRKMGIVINIETLTLRDNIEI